MSQTWRRPEFQKIFPDMLAFAAGLGLAWALRWKTADLVWSLWLSSLTLGYLTILSIIGSGFYIGIKAITLGEVPIGRKLTLVLIGAPFVLFLFGFFSFHFCGFHAAHASFLADFFPIAGLSSRTFSDAFVNPVLLWKIAFRHVFKIYGVFLVPAIIAERKHVFAAILKVIKATADGVRDKHDGKIADFGAVENKKAGQDIFFRPYLNVIRMHILIFVFAVFHMLKVESFLLYTIVYFVYFFPWSEFRAGFASQSEESPDETA